MALFDLVKPRTIELGKIKIGGLGESRQKQGGGTWRLPVKHDHFTVTTLHRDQQGGLIEDADLMDSLAAQHADSDGKLRQLPIAVLSNDIEDIVKASYVRYVGKRLAAKSDGKELVEFFRDGKWLAEPITRAWEPRYAAATDEKGNRIIKLHTTFNCVIASEHAKWGGYYKLRTTSEITAAQLVGSLLEIKALTGGVLRGLPLRLVVRPLQVSPEGKTTTVYIVHCELVGRDLKEIQQIALERARFELANAKQLDAAQREYRKLLAAPGERETAQEQAEVAEEFHPEAADDVPAVDPLAAQLGITTPAVQDAEFTEKPAKPVDIPEAAPATLPMPKNGTQYASEEQLAALATEGTRIGWAEGDWKDRLTALKVRGGLKKLTTKQADSLLAEMRERSGQELEDPDEAMNRADWLSDFADRVDSISNADEVDALRVELSEAKWLTDEQREESAKRLQDKASRILRAMHAGKR